MGIYDREYYRETPQQGLTVSNLSLVNKLIILNVAIFFLDLFTKSDGHFLISELLGLQVGNLSAPWYWWRFLTYGFVHAPGDLTHVGFNMLALYFFGRDLEAAYGPKEFLRFYLAAIVIAGLVWAAAMHFGGAGPSVTAIGASGGVAAVVILFAMHFPRREVLLFFILPVPAWVMGTLLVGADVMRHFNGETGVAYQAHLAGAAFALIYRKAGWNLGRWWPGGIKMPRFRPRPRLRVHDPSSEERALERRVDYILEKISREGEESLTRQERRVLEQASRRYQQKRR